MRKLLFTLLLSMFSFGTIFAYTMEGDTIQDAYAIFDPATADTSTLVDGMSIVDLNGKKYLQVIVNGWNSTINVPEFQFGPGMTAFAEFKYKVGQNVFLASQINGAVQLIDTVNKMTVSWSTTPVNSTTGLIQSGPSGNFVKTSAAAAATMKVVHQVQFFGQETSSWGAVTGDTIWVGKVRAYKVDKNTIFDPTTYDPDNLLAGMQLVAVNGKDYLQVIVNGWNSTLNVPEFTLKDGVSAFCEFKYKVGQTQFAASQINAAVQLIDTVNKTTVSWSTTPVNSTTGIIQSGPSGEFVKSSASIGKDEKLVHQVQFFGQETSSWGAVVGDTIWVGKVRAYKKDNSAILDPETFDVTALPTGWDVVTLSNTKYFKIALDGWNRYLAIDPYTTPKGTVKASMMVKYEVGTSGFELSKINTFLKFADPSWVEIVSAGTASSADFKEYTLNVAEDKTIAIFQVAGQETTGWTAVSGDKLYVGKISAVQTAKVTFIVDDSNLKTSTGFGLKGSWKTATGVYDANWNDGAEHTKFFDDGTHGDATAGDNKWSVALDLVVDNGANNWEWGINDAKGNWVLVGANQKFKLNDAKSQTLTYANTVSANNFGNARIKVYPNPAHDMITISNSDLKSVEIYTIAGAKVFGTSTNCQNINVASLKAGSYIIKAYSTDGNAFMSKFVKN